MLKQCTYITHHHFGLKNHISDDLIICKMSDSLKNGIRKKGASLRGYR